MSAGTNIWVFCNNIYHYTNLCLAFVTQDFSGPFILNLFIKTLDFSRKSIFCLSEFGTDWRNGLFYIFLTIILLVYQCNSFLGQLLSFCLELKITKLNDNSPNKNWSLVRWWATITNHHRPSATMSNIEGSQARNINRLERERERQRERERGSAEVVIVGSQWWSAWLIEAVWWLDVWDGWILPSIRCEARVELSAVNHGQDWHKSLLFALSLPGASSNKRTSTLNLHPPGRSTQLHSSQSKSRRIVAD